MKKCLVICPFGEEESEVRKRSDDLFEGLIKPLAEEVGYTAFRSIDDAQPGEITSRIIKDLYDSDLVIADLTGCNPNVFYELALRHSVAKPYILVSEDTAKLPFDVAQLDVITLGDALKKGLVGYRQVAVKLRRQIEQIEIGNVNFKTPAWALRPENQDDDKFISAKAYEWRIYYSRTLAAEWLEHQDDLVQTFVHKFLRDETVIPDDDCLREALAEYMTYKVAQGQALKGELYYKIQRQTGRFGGWGILSMAHGLLLTIQVYGNELKDGSVIMNFDQPAQTVTIAKGADVEIRGFKYVITFRPNPVTKVLEGRLGCNQK